MDKTVIVDFVDDGNEAHILAVVGDQHARKWLNRERHRAWAIDQAFKMLKWACADNVAKPESER